MVVKSSGKIAELERLAYLELTTQALDPQTVFETHTGDYAGTLTVHRWQALTARTCSLRVGPPFHSKSAPW